MAIGYSPEPREIIYHALDYSNIEAIQGLLRFYHNLKSDAGETLNTELLCILLDIDRAVENCNLTNRQKEILSLYMAGWTFEEIGEMAGCKHQVAVKHMQAICRKMSKVLEG